MANVVDLVSEGEVAGLDDGFKSIYLDGTPVQDANGNNNFEGYQIETRNGTQSQPYISSLAANEIERTNIGLPVQLTFCLLYTSPSPRDRTRSRMPSSA